MLQIVPLFDANQLKISSFLETLNDFIIQYCDPQTSNCVQNITIVYGIYSKLIGNAGEIYTICGSKDWQQYENGVLFDLVKANVSALHNFVTIPENLVQNKMGKTFYKIHIFLVELKEYLGSAVTFRVMKPFTSAEVRQE